MTTEIRTMQDLLEALPALGYSPNVVNQIRPRIKDCARIYNAPLERIPADHRRFIEQWGAGHVAAIPAGFASHKKFVEFRKRVAGALARVSRDHDPAVELSPDWEDLLRLVRDNSGPGKLLGPHRSSGVSAVGAAASAAGVHPANVTDGWVAESLKGLRTTKRRTFKKGVDAMNALTALRGKIDGIDDLVPAAPLAAPEPAKARGSGWRRSADAQAADLWRDFDHFVAEKRGADAHRKPLSAEESDFGAESEKTYKDTLAAATGVLERAGDLQPGDRPRLHDICNLQTLTRYVELWQTRMFDDEVSKDASTLYSKLSQLAHIAEHQNFLSKKERKKLRKLRDAVRKASKYRDTMSAPRLTWIKAFARSPAQQRAVHTMPEQLMREADGILKDWKRLKEKKRQKLRMRALHLGVAAVQAAILFRGSALRAANLRALSFRGPDARLHDCPQAGDYRISIPAIMVKNGVEIESECDPDARHVIEWYLREIRPRLIDDHPYGRKLVDSDFLFPSQRADRPMEETTFAEHYRVGIEAVGLDMTLHQARHVTVYFVLAEDPNAIKLAAAVLNDEVSTVKDHYAWMDGVKVMKQARSLLRQSRKGARKHRKGEYRDAA